MENQCDQQTGEAYDLPSGWTSEPYVQPHLMVLQRPSEVGGGFVTIDFKRRVFSGGIGTPRHDLASTKTYGGRGWKQQIVSDAVAFLEGVMNG